MYCGQRRQIHSVSAHLSNQVAYTVLPIERIFLSPPSFRYVIEEGCKYCHCLLSAGAFMSFKTTCKPGLRFSSPVNLSHWTPYQAIDASWESENNLAQVGAMSIWATFSCYFLVPSGPDWASSPTHLFHLMMGQCMHNKLYSLTSWTTFSSYGQLSLHNLVARGWTFGVY
jgi:hypothetical protein